MLTKRRVLSALPLVLLCIAALSPRTAAQSGGGTAGPPQRIVSLVPAVTEMLFEMGAGSRVVGVSSYDHFPPDVERIAKVGGLLDPNVERLLSLKPDLVIVYDSQTALKDQLQRAGLPVFNYVHRGLADIMDTMRVLGNRVGAKAAADAAAARIDAQLDAVRRRVANRPRPSTLLVIGREQGTLRQIHASGGYGFLHDVLELAGGNDVLGGIGRQSVMMNTEMVLTTAPQVILELHYGASIAAEMTTSERRVWNALASVPAVRNNRVVLLAGDEFVIPGTRIAIAAERMARALHPDAYR